MFQRLRNIGPATLVAAAFIGPGTVTMCMFAGIEHGYELLWAMIFSVLATIVLQEMAARISVVTKERLSKTLMGISSNKTTKFVLGLLILSAIVLGNTAYEAGNISGAAMGIKAILSESNSSLIYSITPFFIGIIATLLLFFGKYKYLEKGLIALVILLSISFIVAAFLTTPNIPQVLKGLFIPTIPDESILKIMGLVGTTVVPYNLFLHSSLIQEKWGSSANLKDVRIDLYISVIVGGIISMMIIVTGAALHKTGAEMSNVGDMVMALESSFGSSSKYVMGIGLFAAGITSAITAPLAAAYVCAQVLGFSTDIKSRNFRMIWFVIILLGVIISSTNIKPVMIIYYAQFTNGLLLPIMAGLLLWVVNKRTLMKNHRNNRWQNILGLLIFIISLSLGVKSIVSVLGLL